MACEMSWPTLLVFLEHDRYRCIAIEIDADIDDIDKVTGIFMMNISSRTPHTHGIGTVITF